MSTLSSVGLSFVSSNVDPKTRAAMQKNGDKTLFDQIQSNKDASIIQEDQQAADEAKPDALNQDEAFFLEEQRNLQRDIEARIASEESSEIAKFRAARQASVVPLPETVPAAAILKTFGDHSQIKRKAQTNKLVRVVKRKKGEPAVTVRAPPVQEKPPAKTGQPDPYDGKNPLFAYANSDAEGEEDVEEEEGQEGLATILSYGGLFNEEVDEE